MRHRIADSGQAVIVDVHAHVTGPAELYAYFRELQASPGPMRPRAPTFSDEQVEASLADHLQEVASVGTDVQLVSPRPWAIPTADRREAVVQAITQRVNDIVAQAVRLHPDRLVGMAGLPQVAGMSPANCADELERCVTQLGFVGCKINPDPGEGGLQTPSMGDEHWYPLYEKMVALDVPALIHGGPYRFGREPELGYFCTEEAVAAWGLLRSRVFQDFPTLKIIVGHGGGYVPYQVGRGRAFRLNEMARAADVESFDTTLRRLWFDTVLYNIESLDLLVRVVGVDRCVFGSDKPANGSVMDPLTGRVLNDIKLLVESIDWLSDDDRAAVYVGNARALFSRLRLPA
ncbi:MAG TPA: amidohydrolase family protein [Chloroflexota bacterium]|jgi:4-oxalmesaconate hydratase|nr:amidohydrolase family protein [Chloroflexota bacterium]